MGNTSSSSNSNPPSVEMVKMKGNDNDLLTQRKADLEKKIVESKANLTTFGGKVASNVKIILDKELSDLENQLEAINQKILSANRGGGKRKSKRTKSKRSKRSKKSNKSNKSKRTRK